MRAFFGFLLVATLALAPSPLQAQPAAAAPAVTNQRPQDTTCVIDNRGNILILKHVKEAQVPAKNNSNIPKLLDAGGIESYEVCDTAGFAGRSNCQTFIPYININTVKGDGLLIDSSGTTICHGAIANVTGSALVISGSNNTVSDIVIAGCGTPVKFLGHNNIVVGTLAATAKTAVSGSASQSSVEGHVLPGGSK